MERKKVGRPSKGPRVGINLQTPIPLRQAAGERAATLGMTLTDYLCLLIEQDTGTPATQPQEGLPISA